LLFDYPDPGVIRQATGLLWEPACSDCDVENLSQGSGRQREGKMEILTEEFKIARDFLLTHREDYVTAVAEFRWPKLARFNWAFDWFDQIAMGDRGGQPALWVVGEDGTETKLTFHELAERSSQIASYFRSLGMNRGDRLLLMLGNVPELWETMLAAMKLGAVVIPTTTLLIGDDIRDRIARAGVGYIISTAEHAAKFEHLESTCVRIAIGQPVHGWHNYSAGYAASSNFEPNGETSANDPLQLYFTSGTTTKPKLVMHTQTSYPIGHLSTMYWLGLRPGDIHINLSSPGWAKHSWSCFFAPWNAEATVLVVNQARFSARNLLSALERCGVTSFCAPPTVWRMLIKENLDAWKMKLREVASAGEPLNPEVIERVRMAWGLMIRDGYGQTETTAMIGNPPGQPLKLGSMGRPLPGYRILLIDANEREADEGEVCICLDPHPMGLMPGYYTDNKTIQPITGPVYRTGDIAARDADGYLTFIGRTDDVFKSSDYRISPFELESALIKHPDVMECAVVPAPDPIRQAVPKAFVLLRVGVEPSREIALSIFEHIRITLAGYKRVRRIEFVDLPKTVSGKIRRVDLRRIESVHAVSGIRSESEYREDDFPELWQ
jgi:acetyl-CoA synthetase